MHWAAKRGHKTIVRRLLQNGANPKIKSAKGQIAAELATDPDIVKLLGGRNNSLNR